MEPRICFITEYKKRKALTIIHQSLIRSLIIIFYSSYSASLGYSLSIIFLHLR